MITINTNTTAMVAQNNLNTTQSNMNSSMLKLSTGMRINSASDDAAGMQISNRMETQINGLGVAQRNANDAISMAQTAEGAMTEISDMLNRVRDLSLQSASDSNTAEDRAAMQKEANALITEIDRVAETTEFAGIDLLNGDTGTDGKGDGLYGSTASFSFQVGANTSANEKIGFKVTNMNANSLGVRENAAPGFSFESANLSMGAFDGANPTDTISADTDLIITKDDGTTSTLNWTAADTDIAAAQTALEGAFGMNAGDITIGADGSVAFKNGATGTENISDVVVNNSAGVGNSYDVTSSNQGAGKAIDISTSVTKADAAVIAIDKALATVDAQRADLGAVQNRLESTIDNLGNIEQNMTASQSRIKDVDFAKETTNMTSQQMMMQAGSTILSQAKSLPQYATQLLG